MLRSMPQTAPHGMVPPPTPDSSYGYSGGSGTADDPYLISDSYDLAMLAANTNGAADISGGRGNIVHYSYQKYFKQTADIDLNNYDWTPIGTGPTGMNVNTTECATRFLGHYDGGGYTVSGLNVDRTSIVTTSSATGVGLFGGVGGSITTTPSGAEVKNLTVDGTVKGDTTVGGIAGFIASDASIINCTNNATIISETTPKNSTTYGVGGIVGIVYSGSAPTIDGCINNGTVTSTNNTAVGGILGRDGGNATISNCTNHSTVSSTVNTAVTNTQAISGGIIGISSGTKSIKNCYNTGSVTAVYSAATGASASAATAGGIVGAALLNGNIEITNVLNSGSINATYGVPDAEDCANVGDIGGTTGRYSISGNVTLKATISNAFYRDGFSAFGNGKFYYTYAPKVRDLRTSTPTITDVSGYDDNYKLTDMDASTNFFDSDDLLTNLNNWVTTENNNGGSYEKWQSDDNHPAVFTKEDDVILDPEVAAEKLRQAKDAAKQALEDYKSADDYRDEEKPLLADAISDGKDAIENATSIDEVNAALAAAKSAIDDIPTKNEIYDDSNTVVVTSEKALLRAIQTAPENEECTIVIANNILMHSNIVIPANKKITFTDDGQARTLRYGVTDSENATTPFITVLGELTLDATDIDNLTIMGNYSQSHPSATNIYVPSDGKFILNDGTITNGGSYTNYPNAGQGGGINAVHDDANKAHPYIEINGGSIKGNYAYDEGAGVRLQNAEFKMTGGTVENNTCSPVHSSGSGFNQSKGGGIYAYYSDADIPFDIDGEIRISEDGNDKSANSTVVIQGNNAAFGGGIFIDYSTGGSGTSNISGALIKGNNYEYTAGKGGGGIAILGSDPMGDADLPVVRTVNLNNSWVEGNQANGTVNLTGPDIVGGGIAVIGRDAAFNMNNSYIKGNTAKMAGGGIYVNSNYVNLNSGEIWQNRATQPGKLDGGANYDAEGGGIYFSRVPIVGQLHNAVIYNNSARFSGGGIWSCPMGSYSFLEDNAVFGNRTTNADGAAGDDILLQNTATMAGQTQQQAGNYLSDRVLGGGTVTYYQDGAVLSSPQSDWKAGIDTSASRYDPSNPGEAQSVSDSYDDSYALKAVLSDEAKALAIASGKLLIHDNSSAGYGGGVGTNAAVNANETPSDWQLTVSKDWENTDDADREQVYVQLFAGNYGLDILPLKSVDEDTEEVTWGAVFTGLPEAHTTTDSSGNTIYYFTTDQNDNPIPLSVKEWADKDGTVEVTNSGIALSVDYSGLSVDTDSKKLSTTITNINPEPVENVIEAKKTFDGKAPDNGAFSFTLNDADGKVLQTVKNTSGNVKFESIKYTKAGTYKYTIKEVQGTSEDIIYDGATFNVTVTVAKKDDEMKLVATTVYLQNDKAISGVPVFANTTKPTETTTTTTPTTETTTETTTTETTATETSTTVTTPTTETSATTVPTETSATTPPTETSATVTTAPTETSVTETSKTQEPTVVTETSTSTVTETSSETTETTTTQESTTSTEKNTTATETTTTKQTTATMDKDQNKPDNNQGENKTSTDDEYSKIPDPSTTVTGSGGTDTAGNIDTGDTGGYAVYIVLGCVSAAAITATILISMKKRKMK